MVVGPWHLLKTAESRHWGGCWGPARICPPPSFSSPRLLHRDAIFHLPPGPSLSRGGDDPGPFGEFSGVLFSKKPVLRELQVIRGWGWSIRCYSPHRSSNPNPE